MFFREIALLVTLLVVSAAQAQETSMVPVIVDGQTVHLEVRSTSPRRNKGANSCLQSRFYWEWQRPEPLYEGRGLPTAGTILRAAWLG